MRVVHDTRARREDNRVVHDTRPRCEDNWVHSGASVTLRIAVTGASGFIGGRIARALQAAGHDVWSYGRRAPEQLTAPLPRYTSWDIAAGVHDLSHIDVVVHSAAQVAPWGSDASFHAVNAQGTRHVVQSASPAAQFIYISTGSIYNDTNDGSMPAYARSKLAGEGIAMERDGPTVVIRPRIVYGPGDTTLWPRIRDARRGDRLFVPGTGQNRVSVTHVDHIVQAVECAMQRPHVTGVFDITDDVVPTMQELLRTTFARHSMPVQITYVPRGLAWAMALGLESIWRVGRLRGEPRLTRYAVKNLADDCVLSCAAAREQLDYAPVFTYRDGPLTPEVEQVPPTK